MQDVRIQWWQVKEPKIFLILRFRDCPQLHFLSFFNFLFYIGVLLINNVVIVSDAQQRDSATHTHVSIFPFPSWLPHNIAQLPFLKQNLWYASVWARMSLTTVLSCPGLNCDLSGRGPEQKRKQTSLLFLFTKSRMSLTNTCLCPSQHCWFTRRSFLAHKHQMKQKCLLTLQTAFISPSCQIIIALVCLGLRSCLLASVLISVYPVQINTLEKVEK